MAKINREIFFSKHPYCIFCGGAKPATTKEHCPPRALFQSKRWPEGFEFPACLDCNNGTSNDDVLIAWLGRVDPFVSQRDDDGRMKGLISNVSNQHPDFFRQMVKSPNEARRSARQLGLHPPIGSTYQEIGIVNVPERLHEAVKTFAKKLTKAVYWRETSTIFPLNGQMMFNWFTNATVLQLGSIPIFDAMASFMGTPQTVARTGKDLSGQFAYKYAVRPKGELAVLQAYFGKSFGFVSIVSSAPNVLAKIVENAKEKSGRDDLPFEFL